MAQSASHCPTGEYVVNVFEDPLDVGDLIIFGQVEQITCSRCFLWESTEVEFVLWDYKREELAEFFLNLDLVVHRILWIQGEFF